jgi:hypothetical protein
MNQITVLRGVYGSFLWSQFFKTIKVLLNSACVGIFTSDTTTSESRSEMPGKFWNVVLMKNGEDQLDRSCEKWRSITQSQGGEEYRTYSKKKKG